MSLKFNNKYLQTDVLKGNMCKEKGRDLVKRTVK